MKAFSHYFRRVSPFATTPTDERSDSRPSDTVVGAADKSNPYSNDLAMMDGGEKRPHFSPNLRREGRGKLDSPAMLIFLPNDGKDSGSDSELLALLPLSRKFLVSLLECGILLSSGS